LKADEIFILVLIVVCVGAVAAMAVHSRRRENAPEAQSPPAEDNTATTPQAPVNEELAEPRERRKKRRR